MHARRHSLIAVAAILLAPLTSQAEEEKSPDKASAIAIGERMTASINAWYDAPQDSRPRYDRMLQKVVDSLSDEEVRLVASFHIVDDCNELVFRRWATRDPAAALRAARAVEDANADEIRLAGTSLEGGPGEAMSAYVEEMFLGAVDGWARVDPKQAWDAFKKQEGPFAKSQVVEDFRSNFYPVIFDPLAKADPDFAFAEVAAAFDDDEFLKAHLLAGYLRGAPRGRSWGKEADRLLARQWKRDRIYPMIATALMGRWLEDSPDAAMKWFQEGDVEGLHWSLIDPPDPNPFLLPGEKAAPDPSRSPRRRHHLGSAAGYWAARDFPAAWRWMKTCPEYHQEGFESTVLKGMSDFFDEETWGQQGLARDHCLEQIAKLPEQADRDQFAIRFAPTLWRFDSTQFIGKPPPDRAKWLEDVRKSLPSLRLSPDGKTAVLEKLRGDAKSEPHPTVPAAE